jgi:ADP-heptose:LPS heptosyltransferase
MKVLVARFSSIGDIILTTPILRCIKQQKPDSIIHYITKTSFRPILANNPHIDKLVYFDEEITEVLDDLKQEKYDCIVDLHRNVRSLRLKRALKVPSYTFPKLNVKKWMLVNFKLNMMPDKSIVERYFEAVIPIGVHNDGEGLEYPLPSYGKLKSSDVPMSLWGGYVGMVIGGSYNTKKLPVHKWVELINLIPYPVMLLGGKEDYEEGQQIALADKVRVYNACGKFSLNESAQLVKMAKIIVSNDTGLMHMAAAFQKPIVSLWGNTSPEMGMFPYFGSNNLKTRVSPKSLIVENNDLHCHPCSKIGYSKCPKGHFKCMNNLDMSKISDFIKKNWIISQP